MQSRPRRPTRTTMPAKVPTRSDPRRPMISARSARSARDASSDGGRAVGCWTRRARTRPPVDRRCRQWLHARARRAERPSLPRRARGPSAWSGRWSRARTRCSAAPSCQAGTFSQYEILDWIATAEPNSRGQGSLKITARIQNRGPLPQPYPVRAAASERSMGRSGRQPHVRAGGISAARHATLALMSPGETMRAQTRSRRSRPGRLWI